MVGGIVAFPASVAGAVSLSGGYGMLYLCLALLAAAGAVAVLGARGKHASPPSRL